MEMGMKVLMVGSARESGGGVASVIRLMEKMPIWQKYGCHWLGTQIQRNYLWKIYYALKAYVWAVIHIWQYDIVHFHTVPDRIGLVIQFPVFFLALIGRKKIIVHIHMGNQLSRHTENGLFLWHLKRADLIILLARKWQALFPQYFPSVKTPTAVLYNASNTKGRGVRDEGRGVRDEGRGVRDEGRGMRDEGRGKSIIFVGYMDDNKAPDILLDAVSQLKAEGKLGEWKVTMMGNGDVERFAKMSEEMGLKDNVTFTGYITGKEKERNFSEASILVLCSYEEGFPMVVLEAWNYGISVISTPVGGLPDVVDEGKNCLTFPFGDSRALAQQLHKLMTDEKLRDDMGRYSKEFVDRTFSIDRISSDADAIYESLSL